MDNKPLLIKNAYIVRGDGSKAKQGSVLIEYREGKGFISALGKAVKPDDCRVFDADGAYILPSFVDIGCHFYDPKHQQRDSIASVSAAATGSGFSTLVCEPYENGEPIPEALSNQSCCKIVPARRPLTPDSVLRTKNAVFSDGGDWIDDPCLAREIMLSCKESESLYISSCIDKRLAGGGVLSAGSTAKMLGMPAIPETAETVAVARDVLFAEETGCRLHIKAISSGASAEIVRQAKKRGVRVSCGTSPLYFSMTDRDVFYYGGSAKLLPPLRGKRDVSAICEALFDKTIDCISSLHTPHTKTEKCLDLSKCAFGASGLDTVFSASVTYLVKSGVLGIERLAELLSVAPASLIGVDTALRVGMPANLVAASLDSELVVSTNSLRSKSVNTPFLGATLHGAVKFIFDCGIRL